MVHAKSSVTHFGGKPEDYLPIHILIDGSRDAFPDLRHRALTHHPWFINNIVVRIFGETIRNSAGRDVSVREIGEHHVLEDFGGKFMPSAQDYLEQIEFQNWMDNGTGEAIPPSHAKLKKWQKDTKDKKPKSTTVRIQRIHTTLKKLFEGPSAPFEAEKGPPTIKSCGPPGTFD